MSKIKCATCDSVGAIASAEFDLVRLLERNQVVVCLTCEQPLLVEKRWGMRRRVTLLPRSNDSARRLGDLLVEVRVAWTNADKEVVRQKLRQRRSADKEALDQEHGVRIPAWWYFWPDGLDETGDTSRLIFLPENMPLDLVSDTTDELSAKGVRLLPGEKAVEMLIQWHVDETGVALSPDEQKAFIREYLERRGSARP